MSSPGCRRWSCCSTWTGRVKSIFPLIPDSKNWYIWCGSTYPYFGEKNPIKSAKNDVWIYIFLLLYLGMFDTAPALAPPLMELSQTVSALPKMGAELGRALSQNELEYEPVWYSSSSISPRAGTQPNSFSFTKTKSGAGWSSLTK